jgi:hypothetical protein
VPVNGRTGEHLLYTLTPGMLADPSGIPPLSVEELDVFCALQEHVEQLRHPLPGQKRRRMKDENKVVESFEQALKHLVARLPPEQRLAGLAPEQSGRRQPRPDIPPADKNHARQSAPRAGRARLAPRSKGQ